MMHWSTILLLALLPCRANAFFGRALLDTVLSGPGACDESFPLAGPPKRGDGGQRSLRQRRLVAIPRDDMGEYYETGEYYAPLCSDGRHIDIRKLQYCNSGSCWNDFINVSSSSTRVINIMSKNYTRALHFAHVICCSPTAMHL